MQFLTGAFLVVSILFMCVFMFIGIWLFIVALKSHRQLRYHNYILEKICQRLTSLCDKISVKDLKNDNYDYLIDDENHTEMVEDASYDNISDFEKAEKFK
ncbi:hypothetical protein [Clostridium uliginosum]|uniref:Uncharacterized protein n=1 Tax=Clostridium uliginosum TaxID=119641 RepID=A0A1I1J6L2_9CLOT|nr:hypothetical protein [Clostridium uliginosum]SFC44249.1 hypothetical protein SAMN05421842_103212 [Clostridium uliginosum]